MDIDKKIAELEKAKRAMERQKKEESLDSKTIKEDIKQITQDEVNEAIKNGELIINDRTFKFTNKPLLGGIINMPTVDNYFEQISDTKENFILKQENEGVSMLLNLIPCNSISTDFKKGMEENFKKMGLYIEWLEEGCFEKEDGKLIKYFTFSTPTGMGKVYNVIFSYERHDCIIMGNFNSMESNVSTWEKIFKGIIELATL